MTEFHDNRPADSAEDMELRLRSLQPDSCDGMLPETMYQAGWAAAMASRQMPAFQKAALPGTHAWSRTSALRFVSGAACGLLCGLLISARLFSGTENQQPLTAASDSQTDQPQVSLPVPPVADMDQTDNPDGSDVADDTSSSGVPQLLASLFDWNTTVAVDRMRPTGDSWNALSPAARSTWNAAQHRGSFGQNDGRGSEGTRSPPWPSGPALTPLSTQRLVIDDLL